MSDTALAARVKLYLDSKFSRNAFSEYGTGPDKGPLHFAVRGIKAKLWFKVVKPELERIAQEHDYALVMLVEKPTNQFLEFAFTARKVTRPPHAAHEPPLTDMELRKVRKLIWGMPDPKTGA